MNFLKTKSRRREITSLDAQTGALLDARPASKVDQPPISGGVLMALTGAGLIGASALGLAFGHRNGARPSHAARLAASGAALLAASVLADSAMEHFRGNYKKPAMFVAPTAAAVTLATSVATALSVRFSGLKAMVFGGAITTGLFGTGFHIKNILSRPGGLSFNNLFYRAPFGAPGALALAGAAGMGALAAERAEEHDRILPGGRRHRAGQGLGLLTAAGLFGLTAEVGLLHFRGAFHNKLMYAPVIAVPMTGAAILRASLEPTRHSSRSAGRALATTTALGLIGSGLHAYGVSRNMGGFRNWTQNLFQGPPIAAPPSLAGIALMGFSSLELLKSRSNGGRQ